MTTFTVASGDLQANGPIIDLTMSLSSQLAQVLRRSGKVIPYGVRVRALVDTGATKSAIAPSVVTQLGLEPFDFATVHSANAESSQCGLYKADLELYDSLTNRVVLPNTTLVGVMLASQSVQALIGRDILRRARFVYEGFSNSWGIEFFGPGDAAAI